MIKRACLASLVLIALLPCGLASAATFQQLLALRDKGAFEDAVLTADDLLQERRENADVLMVRGQVLGFLGRYDAAISDLREALDLAPAYVDIRLTLARVLGYQERFKEALSEVDTAIDADPTRIDSWLLKAHMAVFLGDQATRMQALGAAASIDDGDPALLLALGDAARDEHEFTLARSYYDERLERFGIDSTLQERLDRLEQQERKWTYTTIGSFSDFKNSDRSNWREWFNEITYKVDDDTALLSRLTYANRYDLSDVEIGVGWDQRYSETLGFVVSAKTTPDADFLPKASIAGDLTWRAWASETGTMATNLNAGVQLSRYNRGTVRTLRVGATQYFGRFWAGVQLSGILDEEDHFDNAWTVRLDFEINDSLRVFAGGGMESDTEAAQTRLVRTVFAGATIRINERLRWFIDATYEDPENSPVRRGIATGISVAF